MAVKNEEEKIRVNPTTSVPPSGAALPQQPEAQQPVAETQPAVETKPKYMIDWDSGISPRDAYNQGNLSTYDIIRDHMRWQNDNGRNYNVLDYMFSPDDDPYKSKKENDKERKNQQMADMFEGLGNVLSSFAQFGGALAGAPAPTNLKDPAEMTERQRRLRDKTLEQRRGYNKNLFAALKQQQADEYKRENQRIMEEYKRALAEASKTRADSQAAQGEAKERYWDAKTGQIVEMTPAQIKKIEEQIKTEQGKRGVQGSQINANNALADQRRNGSKGSSKGKDYGKEDKGRGY